MLLLELLFVLSTERHHGGHVALVEVRKHGRLVLGRDEARRDVGEGEAALVAQDQPQPPQLLDQRDGKIGEMAGVGQRRIAKQRGKSRHESLSRQRAFGRLH